MLVVMVSKVKYSVFTPIHFCNVQMKDVESGLPRKLRAHLCRGASHLEIISVLVYQSDIL